MSNHTTYLTSVTLRGYRTNTPYIPLSVEVNLAESLKSGVVALVFGCAFGIARIPGLDAWSEAMLRIRMTSCSFPVRSLKTWPESSLPLCDDGQV